VVQEAAPRDDSRGNLRPHRYRGHLVGVHEGIKRKYEIVFCFPKESQALTIIFYKTRLARPGETPCAVIDAWRRKIHAVIVIVIAEEGTGSSAPNPGAISRIVGAGR
jgi:hypothetical protein